MYHQHSQQQGSQSFSNGSRPTHHQPSPNQNRPPSDMLSQAMGFQFPRPTQLPDELESALAIRGARDMDHRLIDHMSRPNQNQSSGSGIGQHGTYSSNPALTSDNQTSHQQGVDWSTYQPPTKLFASPPPSAGHQSQRHQGPQQQAQNSHGGTSISSWTASASDSPSPQARHPLAGGSGGGGGDGQGLYTPESAGSILASFGLSNEDLEVLSHYPDDQLTPDTLPFILRDIQINKSGNKTAASTSSSTFSSSIHEMPLPPSRSSPLARSHSPEVPSLLTVTQTAGKVIDYGHASRAKDQSDTRETFKRERLSGERTVKMYPSSASSSTTKVDKTERRQVRLEHTESSKHGDRDYRRTSNDHRKNHRSPGREFPPLSKSHNLDQDYRRDGPKSRPSSETRSEASSRRSLSSSSGSKLHSSSKKLPTPTMISDFSAVSPKVYPHTCSLCHIQCDQEKDWVDHINTVNHTAACRDLRNKYPDWKPNLPSRSGRYGSRALWDPKDQSPSHSVSRSLSYSPSPSPPHSKLRVGPHPPRPHGRPYSPHHHPRNQRYPGGPSRGGVKRPLNDSVKFSASIGRHPSSSKAVHGSKHGPPSSARSFKSGTKPGAKTPKTASSKAADTSAKPPPAKKKKKMSTPASKDSSVANRLVYLTGIPEDASEQDITDLVGSFGKINNVILMPCSEEERKKGQGQKASVCMVKAEDAQALASSTNLSIRDQEIIASVAKKPLEKAVPSSDADNSKPAPGQDKGTAAEDAGGEASQKTSDEKAMVLITGLPESGWSESDIIKLIQPFGTPSDIILATQIGKALVTVPDVEIVEEMVKVHAFVPLKIKDCELKIVHLKQCICLSTPVALYNLLMGSGDPLENPAPVGWSSLLVINNVPSTPSGPSEVQKLVRRFGTVIKTLVLNSMVICEMATAAMALSVYKRFQTFPCIIHNNPLFFSRKPDPKNNPQTKVITAYLDSSEDTHVKGSQTTAAAADVEEKVKKEDAGSLMVKDGKRKDEKTTSAEKTADHEASVENRNKDKLTESVSDSAAASEAKPDADVETDVRETSEVESVAENKDVDVSKAGNDSTPAGGEMKTSSSDGKAASQEMDMPELPKVTPEMVSALLVECRTRTAGHPNNPAAPANGEQEAAQTEAKQGRKAGKESPTNPAEEEEAKRQERERKEREARKEKERKERERRAREKEERAKKERERNERARRERERREEERREWERRERERRGRKRSYGEGVSDLRSSYKQSSWKDEHRNNSGARTVEEDEDFDEFPFNMSDFVTVDEVGDVADLPVSPSPAVPMDTTEGEDVPSSVQNDASGDVSTEVTTETRTSDTTGTQQKSESEPEPVSEPTADTSGGLVSSGLSSGADFTAAASPASQSAPTCQPEAPETETTLTAEVEPSPTPVPAVTAASSDGPETGVVTAKSEEEEKESQAKVEEVVSDTTENHKKIQDEEDKETEAPAEETGKNESSEEQTDSVEDKVKKPKKETSTDCLPPFNPSNPVGMEFLVPKTGFFCKVCNRFFSGSREAEISHCKTLKHYENLQKHLKTIKTVNPAAKPESS